MNLGLKRAPERGVYELQRSIVHRQDSGAAGPQAIGQDQIGTINDEGFVDSSTEAVHGAI